MQNSNFEIPANVIDELRSSFPTFDLPITGSDLTPAFTSWLDSAIQENDWLSQSWSLSGELMVWSPSDVLSDFICDGELADALECESLSEVSEYDALEALKPYASIDGSDAPGVHIVPIQLDGRDAFILGLLQLYPGGISANWLGIFPSIERCLSSVKDWGLISIDESPNDEELLKIYRDALPILRQ